MTTLSRRRFLKAAGLGAAGAGVLGTVAALADDGTTYALQGIDISHWQGSINWTSVKNSGKRFAFCKATEGTDFTDPTFATNYSAIRAAGLLRGAYHMGRPAVDAVAQADFLYDTVQPTSGDLPMVLDLEKTDSLTPTAVRAWVVSFVNRLTSRMGRAPIIYTGFFFCAIAPGMDRTSAAHCGWRPGTVLRRVLSRPRGAPLASGSTLRPAVSPASAETSIATPATSARPG